MTEVTTLESQELAAYTKLGGRKFLAFLLVLAVSTVLVSCGVVPPEVFQVVVLADLAGYFAANVWQKSFSTTS